MFEMSVQSELLPSGTPKVAGTPVRTSPSAPPRDGVRVPNAVSRGRVETPFSIIVPTRNEVGNIAALLKRLDAAVGHYRDVAVIFVDDSDDDTAGVILAEGATCPLAVRVLHRAAGQRRGGLGGAVLAGLEVVTTPWAIVMDSDLQHPPETLPAILELAATADIDLVIGSRYTGEGDASGLSGRYRVSVSSLCTRLAKLVFASKLQNVSDPMSGFFAVRIDAVDLDGLDPQGYKILMEIIALNDLPAVRDVTYAFQPRFSGTSKASFQQGVIFLRQLLVLRLRATRRGGRGLDAAGGTPELRGTRPGPASRVQPADSVSLG